MDLAKPIYLDGFFNAAYADLLYDHLPRSSDGGDVWLEWSSEKDHLSIDYGFALEPLWKTLAFIKLEYILRPVLEMLEHIAPSQRDIAEETLAYGLFCCALLSRNYSARLDVFLLNLALGIRLATNLKDMLSECFGWNNWPHSSIISTRKLITYAGAETESSRLILVGARKDNLRRPSSDTVIKLPHRLLFMTSEALVAKPYTAWTEKYARNVPLHWSVPESIDFEAVYLKREDETLALHNRFSIRPQEGVSIVSQRIDLVRKRAMTVR